MTRKEEINSFAIDKLLGLGPAFSENEIQYNNGYMRGAIEGAEWADETMIDKVCEFIRINAYKYRQLKFVKNKATFDFRTDRLIEDLRKSMEQ